MASDLSYVEYIADQLHDAGTIRFRKMFGEYALYCNEKVVALVCDNQLFVKPTDSGRAFIGEVEEAPAYSGAKNSFLISEGIDDEEWISELIRLTEQDLPKPNPKKVKKK